MFPSCFSTISSLSGNIHTHTAHDNSRVS
jgi:hypothetical protein